jgi:uncharacterized damage-inducible protein DinB
MEKFFSDYLDRLEGLHYRIAVALEGLPQQGIDWVPGEEMNSIGVLVTHIAGAERYWIGDVVAGDESSRVRATEFETTGMDRESLLARLDEVLAHSRGVLAGLHEEQLTEERASPRVEERFTLAWSLLHALKHTAEHVGQVEMTRQLWEQRD